MDRKPNVLNRELKLQLVLGRAETETAWWLLYFVMFANYHRTLQTHRDVTVSKSLVIAIEVVKNS